MYEEELQRISHCSIHVHMSTVISFIVVEVLFPIALVRLPKKTAYDQGHSTQALGFRSS